MLKAILSIFLLLGACYKNISGKTPLQTLEAVVQVKELTPDGEVNTGTAWYYTDTRLVTAGHMCDDDTVYFIVQQDGTEGPAWRLYDIDDGANDVCILETAVTSKSTIQLSPTPVKLWDTVYYWGYPANALYKGVGTVSKLNETGHIVVNVDGFFGASGSPVMNLRGEVIGMYTSVNRYFHHIAYVTPLEDVRNGIEQAQLQQ